MTEQPDNQQGQQLQIELRPEIAAGIYSNFALIAHSNTECVLDFASMQPRTIAPFGDGMGQA